MSASPGSLQFTKAVKERAKLRLALIAPPGCGKTYSALAVATSLTPGKVALIDTEHGSAAKYADLFEFDSLELRDFDPENYVAAIQAAERAGYHTVVIDSLSHAWAGKGGALELVDRAAAKSKSGSSFHAWKDVTPKHQALIEAILQSGCHVIATMRSKVEHVYENGKVKKVGLQPVQREGMEYEFDLVGDLDQDHKLVITKSRISALSGQVIAKPGAQLAADLRGWLTGAEPRKREETPAPASSPPSPVGQPGKITAAQLAEIKTLAMAWMKIHGPNPPTKDGAAQAWQSMLRGKYGVGTAAQLTEEKAAELIASLKETAASPTGALFVPGTNGESTKEPAPAPAATTTTAA